MKAITLFCILIAYAQLERLSNYVCYLISMNKNEI